MAKKTIKKVDWRLWAIMADRGIRSETELAELMLSRSGVKLTNSHMSRYTKADPPALTIKMIGALLTTLDAKPEELFHVVDVEVEDTPIIPTSKNPEMGRRVIVKKEEPTPINKPIAGPKLIRFNQPSNKNNK